MPTFVSRSNLPTREPFRWSLTIARRELGLSWGTLSQRLGDANESPAADGCFSSRQLLSACFGSLHQAKLKQTQTETELTSLKASILRNEYLNRAALEEIFDRCAISIKQIVGNSGLSSAEQDDFLRSIARIKIEIGSLAAGSCRAGNGSGDHAKPRKKPGQKPKRPAAAGSAASP